MKPHTFQVAYLAIERLMLPDRLFMFFYSSVPLLGKASSIPSTSRKPARPSSSDANYPVYTLYKVNVMP